MKVGSSDLITLHNTTNGSHEFYSANSLQCWSWDEY